MKGNSMTNDDITVSERGDPRRARTLEVFEQEDGDALGVDILGPKGKVYGLAWIPRADLVAWAQEIVRRYKT
jgi:hypothetical protein